MKGTRVGQGCSSVTRMHKALGAITEGEMGKREQQQKKKQMGKRERGRERKMGGWQKRWLVGGRQR